MTTPSATVRPETADAQVASLEDKLTKLGALEVVLRKHFGERRDASFDPAAELDKKLARLAAFEALAWEST